MSVGIVALFFLLAPLIICGLGIAIAQAIASKARFSLRTLLIATTLVAVVLGLIVWSVR